MDGKKHCPTFSVWVNIILHSSGERVAVSRRLNVPLLSTSGLWLTAAALVVRSLTTDSMRLIFPAVIATAFRSAAGGGATFRGLPVNGGGDTVGPLCITAAFLAASLCRWTGVVVVVGWRVIAGALAAAVGGAALSRPVVRSARLLFCRTKLDSRFRLRDLTLSADRRLAGSLTAADWFLAAPVILPLPP